MKLALRRTAALVGAPLLLATALAGIAATPASAAVRPDTVATGTFYYSSLSGSGSIPTPELGVCITTGLLSTQYANYTDAYASLYLLPGCIGPATTVAPGQSGGSLFGSVVFES